MQLTPGAEADRLRLICHGYIKRTMTEFDLSAAQALKKITENWKDKNAIQIIEYYGKELIFIK